MAFFYSYVSHLEKSEKKTLFFIIVSFSEFFSNYDLMNKTRHPRVGVITGIGT